MTSQENKHKTYSWTASHIESNGRLETLKLMIESVRGNGIDYVQISLSYDPSFKQAVLDFIKKYDKTNVTFFLQDTKMRQFDHLAFLFGRFNGTNDDSIIFIDDDDLYLRPIKWTDKTVIGLQYIPIETSSEDKTFSMSYKEILAIESEWKNKWSKEIDFSGYQSQFSNIKIYFTKRLAKEIKPLSGESKQLLEQLNKILGNIEDIEFMKFLDNLSNTEIPTTPVVFHRIWEDVEKGNVKTWAADIGL